MISIHKASCDTTSAICHFIADADDIRAISTTTKIFLACAMAIAYHFKAEGAALLITGRLPVARESKRRATVYRVLIS